MRQLKAIAVSGRLALHASGACFTLFVWLLVSCGVAPKDGQRTEGTASQPKPNKIDGACLRTIEKHVAKTRAWDRSAYDVVPEKLSPDVRGFSVRWTSDSTFMTKGGLKSFHVDLDTTCVSVVRELKYQ